LTCDRRARSHVQQLRPNRRAQLAYNQLAHASAQLEHAPVKKDNFNLNCRDARSLSGATLCLVQDCSLKSLRYPSNSVHKKRRMPKYVGQGPRRKAYRQKCCLVVCESLNQTACNRRSCLHVGGLKSYCTLRESQARTGEGSGCTTGGGWSWKGRGGQTVSSVSSSPCRGHLVDGPPLGNKSQHAMKPISQLSIKIGSPVSLHHPKNSVWSTR